jgi:hypothetical protein
MEDSPALGPRHSLSSPVRTPYRQMAVHAPAEQEHRYTFRVTISGRRQYSPSGPAIRDRALKTFQLVYLERGHGWFRSGGYHAALTPGTCAVLFPGIPHSFGPTADDPFEIVWITLQGDTLWDILAAAGATPGRACVEVAAAPEPRAVFRELLAARGPYVWRVHALVWSFLARLAAANGTMGASEPAPTAGVCGPGSRRRDRTGMASSLAEEWIEGVNQPLPLRVRIDDPDSIDRLEDAAAYRTRIEAA